MRIVRRNEILGAFPHPQKRQTSFVLSGMRQRKSKNVEPRQPGAVFGSAPEKRMRYQRDPYVAEIRAAHRDGASVWAIARAVGMGWRSVKEILKGKA